MSYEYVIMNKFIMIIQLIYDVNTDFFSSLVFCLGISEKRILSYIRFN